MTILEAMISGKKFKHKLWHGTNELKWMQWTKDKGMIDNLGRPEEIMNRADDCYEFYVEPLVWEKEQVVAGVDMRMGFINVPKKFAGKKFKIRLEEVLE